MNKRGLGRGLSELGLSELLANHAILEKKTSDTIMVAIHNLKPGPFQPRRQFKQEALEELAISIRAQGIIQPIVAREAESGYEIIAGERRWLAAKIAAVEMVPVVVRNIDDKSALAISLIENIQRQDLNVMEEAFALQRLLEEFKMTHQSIAHEVGKCRSSVTNILRLLKLNQDVRSMVEQGLLDMGHARALLALEGENQSKVAHAAVARSLTVRETEELIRRQLQTHEKKAQDPIENQEIKRLAHNLSTRLQARVAIKQNAKGNGRLIISYKSSIQLDNILQCIMQKERTG